MNDKIKKYTLNLYNKIFNEKNIVNEYEKTSFYKKHKNKIIKLNEVIHLYKIDQLNTLPLFIVKKDKKVLLYSIQNKDNFDYIISKITKNYYQHKINILKNVSIKEYTSTTINEIELYLKKYKIEITLFLDNTIIRKFLKINYKNKYRNIHRKNKKYYFVLNKKKIDITNIINKVKLDK